MRVIAGTARGTKLQALPGEDVTRPTVDRVKEAMFSSVQFLLPGAKVLDLFGGSGQLGIEAVSRGARSATIVDRSDAAIRVITANCRAANLAAQCDVRRGEADAFLAGCGVQYDLVLMDPPYHYGTVQRLLPLVRDCLASTSALEREITLINTHKEDSVRVAAYESIARHWLPEIIQQFRREHPDVTVDIQMGSVEEVYRWVTEDRVDMCFASRQESPALEWTFLRDDELLAILPPDYDSAEDTFPIQFFTGQEFLMPSMGFDRDILRVLNEHGVTPLIRTTQVSDSAVISMVEHGLGVSVLSRLVLRGRQNSVRALPLAPRAVRELGIAARPKKELRPIVRRFIQQSCEMIEKM